MAAVGTPALPMGQVGLMASDTLPSSPQDAVAPIVPIQPAPARAVVAPLSADRYLLKVTLSETAHADLECVRDLFRHVVPTGDPAAIVARALAVLRQQLERTRCGATHRPQTAARPAAPSSSHSSRHVPAAVRRAVWSRDQGRCAFVGTEGRCPATGFLEFHHVQPFARGGPTSAENLELRCRAHNAHEAEREFGRPSTQGRGGPAAHARELCPDRAGG
jgi:5-methylcytosine-specific restriction endonuclease McrA